VNQSKLIIQCTDKFDEYVLVTEIPHSNVLEYRHMKIDDIQRLLNLFFDVSRQYTKKESEQKMDSAA
jgi:hypothetical protein